jgi:SAM-dependent methyltransferase
MTPGVATAEPDAYADDHHWGDRRIPLDARDLPALKARYLIEHLPETGRVLEVGCGGGRLLKTVAFHRPELELHGCDVRPLSYTADEFEFRLVETDVPVLPYEPGSFDAVIIFDVLEHLPDPARSLHAVRSVLREGGRLISFTPLEGQRFSFYRMYRRLLGDDVYAHTKGHIHAFSEKGLRWLLAEDFRVVDHAYAYHLVGHLMDATLYAALKSRALHRRYWKDNPYYAEGDKPAVSGGGSPLGAALRAANLVAYAESRALRRRRYGAAGLLFAAETR